MIARHKLLPLHAVEHGTVDGYQNHHCKCDLCLEAGREYMRDYMRAYRAKKKEEQDDR